MLIFKVTTLNTCCLLEPNELPEFVESSSSPGSGQWSHMFRSFRSTQIKRDTLLCFSRCLASTHAIQKDKMANSCVTQEIENTNNRNIDC